MSPRDAGWEPHYGEVGFPRSPRALICRCDGCWTKNAVKQHRTAIKRLIIIVQYAQAFSCHWPDCG